MYLDLPTKRKASLSEGDIEESIVKEIAILDGPNQMDLMFSLFRSTSVKFVIPLRNKREDIWVSIDSLKRFDAEGVMWEFETFGHIVLGTFYPNVTKRVKGTFDIKNRKGTMWVTHTPWSKC